MGFREKKVDVCKRSKPGARSLEPWRASIMATDDFMAGDGNSFSYSVAASLLVLILAPLFWSIDCPHPLSS